MTTENLDRIFSPRSVAIIGASQRPGSVGRTVLDNLLGGGFAGEVYPVNPRHQAIAGRACFPAIGVVPGPVDLAVICTPSVSVPGVVRECGEAGILGLVILSAGFKEASVAGAELEAQVRGVAARFRGMRIVGPNCLGILSPHQSLNVSFARQSPLAGNIAFISQSGALCTAILDWAIDQRIGFSQFVSVGNMLDVSIADLIDYFAIDGRTDSILLYVESLTEPRLFMSAARAFTRTKPIIAYKAGRFARSAQAAASHTGAMAGVDSVYEAAFARAGIVRVFEIGELFDCAEFLSSYPAPAGDRLAIVTNAGGPGVMATDALLEAKGNLATLTPETLAALDERMPAAWSHQNPVDVLGDATPERMAAAVRVVLADPDVDGLLIILSPQAMTDPTATAVAITEVVSGSRKPVLASWLGGQGVAGGVEVLTAAGIPAYPTPERGVRTFMQFVAYGRSRDQRYEVPSERPISFSLDRGQQREQFERLAKEAGPTWTEAESKRLLQAYEIPVTETEIAATATAAILAAERLGYPVVLKLSSSEISHKSDAGGVELNLSGGQAVAAAFERIVSNARTRFPDAEVAGVTVQPMMVDPHARELILGAKRDPVFGPVLLVGAGGITAELLHDRALELPPLDDHLARRMLRSLQTWPLLAGYRGKPGVNIDRLIEVLLRLSTLVSDLPEIAELDINPLWVTPTDAVALDARIVVDRSPSAVMGTAGRPYSHLAIRPYPVEFIRHEVLADGTAVLLRPIRPEDEPMWQEMMVGCSAETIRSRYRYLFKPSTHAIAARYCSVDYDRELAIVAEVVAEGKRRIVGVARLVADAGHRQAEFAVIVADAWQGRGLGGWLTDHCLAISQSWEVRSLFAVTSPTNRRMVEMFRRRGFRLRHDPGEDWVIAQRP